MTDVLIPARKSGRKAKGDGHLRRAEILHAAERICLAQGYEGATIRKIADEVGVSSTALYMHFRDKEDILLEICQVAFADLLAINQRIAAEPAVDPVDRVRRSLAAYMRFALDNPNAYRVVFCGGPPPAQAGARLEKIQLGDQCFETFCSLFEDVARAGRLREPDPKTVAKVLWAACHGLVSLLINKPEFEWDSSEKLMDVMLDSLLSGAVKG